MAPPEDTDSQIEGPQPDADGRYKPGVLIRPDPFIYDPNADDDLSSQEAGEDEIL